MTADFQKRDTASGKFFSPTHSANFERVVRFAGERHFGYDVTCECSFVCKRHYTASGASRCAVNHDRQRSCPPPATVEEVGR